jgi:hypothetical protein
MLFRIALWLVIIIVVLGAGSNDASALRRSRKMVQPAENNR